MFMGKMKKNGKVFLKMLAIILVSIFSCFTLTGCLGGGGGSTGTGSGSSSGSETKEPPKFKNEYADAETISDYNSVLMGAIGVYDINNDEKAFYDNYTGEFVDFNYLIDRQFTTLATVINNSLRYAYGTDTYNGTISNYGSGVSVNFNNLIQTQIFNTQDTLKYANSIVGGYKLIENIVYQIDEATGQPLTDEYNNPIVLSRTYEYSTSEIVYSNAWVNTGFTIDSITKALRYIYVHPVATNNSMSLGSDSNLISAYSGFSGSLATNDDISTIGFSEEYMNNVLYYVAYSIIGANNISNSINGANTVMNGNSLNEVNHDNYQIFQNYKGYEKTLPELIKNAFKLTTGGVGSYYCYDIDNYNSFYNTTLFPILERNEYIFFDDLKDICDAEAGEDGSSYKEIDFDNLKPSDLPTFDPDKLEDTSKVMDKTIKVGSLRKIKKIILIPKIDTNSYDKDDFNIETLNLCFSTTSGECEIEILTNIVDKSGKEYNEAVKFDDGTYSVTMPDGTVVDNNTKLPDGLETDFGSSSSGDNMVTSKGYLNVQSVPSVNKYTNMTSIFADEKTSKEYNFSSVSKEEIIKNSFKSTSYDVATTSEKIEIGRINVCNQLFKMTKVATNEKMNGVESKISINENDNNYIEFEFKYYSKGNPLSEIPALYLLDFSL